MPAPTAADTPTATTASAAEPPPTNPTATPTATEDIQFFRVRPTPVAATLDQTYVATPGGDPLFPPGSVQAHWYLIQQDPGFHLPGDMYAVVYTGAPVDQDLCPGTSLHTGEEFEFISHAPTRDPAACDGFSTPDSDLPRHRVVSNPEARVCGPVIIYLTIILTRDAGTLYGTLEISDGAGGATGGTSMVASDRNKTPRLDPRAPAYSFPPEMVADGDVIC